MKRTVKYFALLCLLMVSLYGCEKMDDSFKKFIVKGGHTYPGKAVDPVAHSGNHRILLSWKKGTDPTIVAAVVYWNNYTDSIEVDIPPTEDSTNVFIENLAEQQFTFQIVTINNKGDRSVPAEVLGNSHGELYQESIPNRPILQTLFDGEGGVEIRWGAADLSDGAYGMQIRYTNLEDQNEIAYFPIEDSSTIISNIKGVSFDFRTVYLPDSTAIDTFYTAYENFEQEPPSDPKSYLIDFAPAGNTEYNQPTESPDKNGNYWNNYTGNNAGSSLPLVDIENNYGGVTLNTVNSFAVNTGAALGPRDTEAGLGDLSITTATMDCFYVENNTGILKFTGLDPSRGYVLSLYGSRVAGDLRETEYTITGATKETAIHQTSGQSGSQANVNDLYVTPVIYPTLEGEIEISVKNKTSVFGYINALKLEEK